MIVCSYNVNKGLNSKIGILMSMIEIRKIDVLCVIEADIVCIFPQIPGIRAYTDSNKNVKRVIMYVRDGIKSKQVIIDDQHMVPVITINLEMMSIVGFIMNIRRMRI